MTCNTVIVVLFLLFSLQTASDSNQNVLTGIVYSTTSQKLDLYLPEKGNQPYPLVIWIHGGGWIEGSKENTGPSMELLKHGFAVASINYRLSTSAKFPAQIQDVLSSVKFLKANAKKYGLNSNKIGAWGHSAGGHLALLLGTGSEIKEFNIENKTNYSGRVQAVCSWAGPTDLLAVDPLATDGLKKHNEFALVALNLIGGPFQFNMHNVNLANPAAHADRSDPPFLIVHGKKDSIVPYSQAAALHDKLKTEGVNSTLLLLEEKGHHFDNLKSDKLVIDKSIDFFKKHLNQMEPAKINFRTLKKRPKPQVYSKVKSSR